MSPKGVKKTMKPLNLLLCAQNYAPSIGGVQEVTRQVSERLVSLGHRVTVATTSYPGRPAEHMARGVRVVSFNIDGNYVRGLTGELQRYRAFVRDGEWDALLINAAQQCTLDALLDELNEIKARKYLIPCGFSALLDPAYANYFARMPDWLSRFDGLVFCSKTHADWQFAAGHGLTRLHFIPNGADEREFEQLEEGDLRRKLGLDPATRIISTVGSLIVAKGHWDLLRGFARLPPGWPAALVINANDSALGTRARLKRLARTLMLGKLPLRWEAVLHNAFAGRSRPVRIVDLERSDVLRLYRASTLFALCSHREYSPLVLFESAAAGTPFMSTPAGNAAEIAEWTGGGVVLAADTNTRGDVRSSPVTVAKVLSGLLSDPAALQAMGRSGREAFLARGFSWAQIVNEYEALLCGRRN